MRLSDDKYDPIKLVMIGAFGSAGALLSTALWSGFWAIVVAIVTLGLSHTLIRAPLYSLVLRITSGPGPGIDALRLFERLGAVMGLIASAILLSEISADVSIQSLGIAVLVGALGYAIVETFQRFRRI